MVFQNHKSRSFRVRRGVPQGSVLGPVLFSLFINDFPASLPSSVSCSFYADDLVIWSSSPSVPTVVEATQAALFRLECWSEYWCLPLNPSKCEASFFSVDPHHANLQPNLLLLGSRLRFNPTPTFLGVTFDRTLSFSKHVSSLKAKFFPRLKALRCISASSWGPSKESLSVLYKFFLRFLLTYASPGWFPFLSVTNVTKLERLHRAASRAITGCLSSSPIPLLLTEASLPPLRVTLTHFTLFSNEWALRLPTSFPISGLARLGVTPRLCKSSWRALASTHPLMLPSTCSREALLACPHLPSFTVESTLSTPCSCSDPTHSRQSTALAHLDSLSPHDLVLWTDGFVPFPFGKGISGVLANCSLCGTEATLSYSAGPVCSSFSAEACVILHALCWFRQHHKVCHFSSDLLLSDSRSVLSSTFPVISNSVADLAGTVHSLLFYQATMGPLDTLFLPGNDTADELARRGALLALSAIPCCLSPLTSRIHSRLFSDRRRTVSSKYFDTQVPSISTEELVLPRHARCVLSRLRCNGHSLLLGSYLYRIGRIENSSCSACGHSSQDISHLILHCPATDSLRRSLFVSVRSLVQTLGSCSASGASRSSAMPPSLGRGRVTNNNNNNRSIPVSVSAQSECNSIKVVAIS